MKGAPPNSVGQEFNSKTGNPHRERFYDANGNAYKDIDYEHAGKYKFPHEHEWVDGKRQSTAPENKLDSTVTWNTPVSDGNWNIHPANPDNWGSDIPFVVMPTLVPITVPFPTLVPAL